MDILILGNNMAKKKNSNMNLKADTGHGENV